MCVVSKDAERLGDELSLQRMKSLSESQRALELERKLFSSERLLKQVTPPTASVSSMNTESEGKQHSHHEYHPLDLD